jgi:hypothetical protein
MNKQQLKEHLWKLCCLLNELEEKDAQTSGKLGLLAKGLEVYDYLQEMELTDALEVYGRLDGQRQAQFREVTSKGE